MSPPMREFWQLNATEVWRDVYVFFPLIYTIPSLILYFIIFYECLCKNLASKSSFYKLFCVCGIIDLLTWFGFFFWVRASRSPLMFYLYSKLPSDGGIITRLILFCVFYGFYGQIISSTILNLNRWTVFALPTKHDWFWKRAAWPLIILVCLSPFCFMNFMFTIPLRVTFFPDLPPYYELAFVHEPEISNALAQLILGVVSNVAVILMNLHSIYFMKLRRQTFSFASRQQTERNKHEIKLLGVSLLIFVNRISIDIIQLLFYLHNPEVVRYLFDIQRYFMDLSCLSPPWYMLLMSASIRQRVKKWFGIESKNNSTIPVQNAHVTIFAMVKKSPSITPRRFQHTVSTTPITADHSTKTNDRPLTPIAINTTSSLQIFKGKPTRPHSSMSSVRLKV